MEGIVVFFLIIFSISIGIAAVVYRRQVKAGKNPWGWSIASFLITVAILVFATYALLSYMFSFER